MVLLRGNPREESAVGGAGGLHGDKRRQPGWKQMSLTQPLWRATASFPPAPFGSWESDTDGWLPRPCALRFLGESGFQIVLWYSISTHVPVCSFVLVLVQTHCCCTCPPLKPASCLGDPGCGLWALGVMTGWRGASPSERWSADVPERKLVTKLAQASQKQIGMPVTEGIFQKTDKKEKI